MAMFGGGGEDQERLLDEASATVKEQAYHMKRAIDTDNLRETLKTASTMICELKTSLLSPKNYYELYMLVFQEMQYLAAFFRDRSRHNKKMVDLYESVQHAGNILPRLYLMATVGGCYIESQEAPAREVLKDMSELCKGVQHPMRGLFLRYYLSQMVKDKLPDTGSLYEGVEGGNIEDAFDFIFTNLSESNRLWVRMQNQGPSKDKTKREKERQDLRVLVGANLVRLSQLDGMTLHFYSNFALPKILDHVTGVRDTMSQQYLFESIIQVFPDEFHIQTLEQILSACTRAQTTVNMKSVIVSLMNRLALFLGNGESKDIASEVNIFSLFRVHLQTILERAMEGAPAATNTNAPSIASTNVASNQAPPTPDVVAALEVLAAFMNFTQSLYPDQISYVDDILGSTVEILMKYFARMGGSKLDGAGAEKIADLLSIPLKTLSLAVLDLEQYPALLSFLHSAQKKSVALSMVSNIVDSNLFLTSSDMIRNLFSRVLSPLVKDEEGSDGDETSQAFITEQQAVCKLVHQVRATSVEEELQMYTTMRSYFGQGGPSRMVHTLQPVVYAAIGLLEKLYQDNTTNLNPKKIFQFIHKTTTAMEDLDAQIVLHLWLVGAMAADKANKVNPTFGDICFEFLTQAFIVYDERLTDSQKQFQEVFMLVGCVTQITCLEDENYDVLVQKLIQSASRLLKKPIQVRAIAACSHLFWCEARRDAKRVQECMQKCLKVTQAAVQADPKQCILWVEMLDKYVYYLETDCETTNFATLIDICQKHIQFAAESSGNDAEAKHAGEYLKRIVSYMRAMQNSNSEHAEKYSKIELGACDF